jgi:hypothetical protein
MCSQNAANAILGIQILKIFGGAFPIYPPRNLVPSAFAEYFAKFPPSAAYLLHWLIDKTNDMVVYNWSVSYLSMETLKGL